MPRSVHLIDTRSGKYRVAPGDQVLLNVGALVWKYPKQIAAVSATITAVDATGPGYLRVMPCGAKSTSGLVTYDNGAARSAHVVIQTNKDGLACVFTTLHAAHIVVDVDGWFTYGKGFTPTWPYRAYSSTSKPSADSFKVKVADPGTKFAYLAFAAPAASAAGYLRVGRCDKPPLSNPILYFKPEATYSNTGLFELSPDGTLCFTASKPTHLVVDVLGIQSVGFKYQEPRVVADTHQGGRVYFLQVTVPKSRAAVLSFVVSDSSSAGHISIRSCNQPRPSTIAASFASGSTIAGSTIVAPDGNGHVCIDSTAAVHLSVDYSGSLS